MIKYGTTLMYGYALRSENMPETKRQTDLREHGKLSDYEVFSVLRKLVNSYELRTAEELSEYVTGESESLTSRMDSLVDDGLVKRADRGSQEGYRLGDLGYEKLRELPSWDPSIFALLGQGKTETNVEFRANAVVSYINERGFMEYGDWKRHVYDITNPDMNLALHRLQPDIERLPPTRDSLYNTDKMGHELKEEGEEVLDELRDTEWFPELEGDISEVRSSLGGLEPKEFKILLPTIFYLRDGDPEKLEDEVRKCVERSSCYGISDDEIVEMIELAEEVLV